MTYEEFKKDINDIQSQKVSFWRDEQRVVYLRNLLAVAERYASQPDFPDVKKQLNDMLKTDKEAAH